MNNKDLEAYIDRLMGLLYQLTGKQYPEAKPLYEELLREIYFKGYAKGYKDKSKK